MGDSPLTSPRFIAFQRFQTKLRKRIAVSFSVLGRLNGNEQSFPPSRSRSRQIAFLSRKVIQARGDLPGDSVILSFSSSTKPIMASQGATENFVARWCSGLA